MEPVAGGGGKEALLRDEADLGFEATVDEKVGPVVGWGIALGWRPHVVVVTETEIGALCRARGWRGDAMQGASCFPKAAKKRVLGAPWGIHSSTSTCRSSRTVQAMVSGVRKKPPAGVFRKYLEGIVDGASANRPEGEGAGRGAGGGSIAGLSAFSM